MQVIAVDTRGLIAVFSLFEEWGKGIIVSTVTVPLRTLRKQGKITLMACSTRGIGSCTMIHSKVRIIHFSVKPCAVNTDRVA